MKGEQKIQQGQLLIAEYEEDNRDLEMILEEDHEDASSSNSFDGSDLSSSSSSSDFLDDDASSSPASSSSDEALFDLSELMSHLPIKRGLSKFYQGKSQSFTSLARVTSLEDLAKKVGEGGYGKRLKACKSYGGGLNLNNKHKSSCIKSPKATISKKSSSSSCLKAKIKIGGFMMGNRSSINGVKPPLNPVQV